MPKDFRMQRIADLIRTALAEILHQEREDERFRYVSITRVSVSRDLHHAKIYVSFMPEEKVQDRIKTLNQAVKQLRYQLAQSIKLRITPELRFYYDDSSVKGQRIVDLLNKALKKSE